MENNRFKFLAVILNLFITSLCFGNERIDTMCGIWSKENHYRNTYETLAIEKLSENKYFILYSDSNDHILDISTVGTVINDQLIHIHKVEDEDFYVYLDYEYDSVYFLWNHTEPDAFYNDVELKRVTELFDEEHVKQKQLENEEELKKTVLDSLRNRN